MKRNIPVLLSPNLSEITHEYTTPNPPHRHTVWELIIFERGLAHNVVNEKVFPVSTGDVCLLGPQHLHELHPMTAEHLHRDIYFSAETVREICDNYSPHFYERLVDKNQLLALKLSTNIYETVSVLCANLDTMIAAYATDGSVSITAISGVAKSILNIIVSLFYTQQKMDKITTPPSILEILPKLQRPEYFTQPVSSIISEISYSHPYFLKLFKGYTGITIVQYLNRMRISYAAELLRTSDLSVLDISEQCGYYSLSYFIKSFTHQYGKTPLRYRKEIRMEG